MEQYTVERFDEWLSTQNIQLFAEPINVKELILDGAKEYYSNVRHIQNDYVTKAKVRETLESAFDQFYQQSSTQDTIEDFANREGIEEEAVHFAIQQRREEFIEYLTTQIDSIAEAANAANDGGED